MRVLMLVKVILWFGDVNLSASVWFHGLEEIQSHWKDSYGVTVEKALDSIQEPPLMEWCSSEWRHMQQPNTYYRLMRKKSNLTAAADSQMQVTIVPAEVSL